ncbi:unnamed protein product [Trichobilharzia szidati]|nr:unnamed protein product [Trichobilharzia szidati]
MSFLLILLTITQYEFEFSKLFNPVDASLTSREYFKRSERFYVQLSRNNNRQLTKSLDNQNSNKWSEPTEGELFKSDMLEESQDNDAADIKSNNNHYNYNINQITENKEYYQLMIEKYKRKILRLLNLKSVPNVNVNNESEWNSLPGVLRNRLKAEIDAANQLKNQVISDDNEEKETLILLNQYKLPVKLPNPNIFTLKVAEEIDPMHISGVTLHIEINGEIRSNAKFTCWEIHPTAYLSKFLWINGKDESIASSPSMEQRTNNENDYNAGESYSEQSSSTDMLITPSFNNPERSYYLSIHDYQKMFKLIKPEIANTNIPEGHTTSDLTVNITNRMIQWLKQQMTNNRPYKPLTKYLLITCNECDNEENIIDPKKVVVEIRYRPRLYRQKRSLTEGDKMLSNVCPSTGHHFGCCTQPLSVKFADIGWDNWIIQPKAFQLNYCLGSCKITSAKGLHYDVMDMILRKNLSQFGNIQPDEIQSCCHPTDLASMVVLYLDSNRELQLHRLHNIIVLGCGCN